MKFKSFLTIALTLLLTLPASEGFSQKRTSKSGTRKTTTSTPKKASNAPTAKPLNKSQIENHGYYGIWSMPGSEKLGKDVGFKNWLFLSDDGSVNWSVVGSDLTGNWSVSGTTLTIKSGALTLSLTSTNEGKTLNGPLSKNGQSGGKVRLYQLKNGEWNKETFKESLEKGNVKALMLIVPKKDEEYLFPVDFKNTSNEDGTGGTYKISIDNNFGIGLIKGTYTFTENGVKFTSNLEDFYTDEYEWSKYREELLITLGKKAIADYPGKGRIYLYLFNQ